MKAKTTSFSPQELYRIFDSETFYKEGDETQVVFMELKRRIDAGIPITFTESLYFYLCLKHTKESKYGTVNDYLVCKEHIFSDLYRIYAPNNLNCQADASDFRGDKIPLQERRKDEQKLTNYLYEWKNILSSKVTDDKINIIRNETQNDLGKIGGFKLLYGSNWVKAQERKLYLRSRFIYNVVLEILEWNGEEINIGTAHLKIKFNPKSLIHIMFRHYGQITKPALIIAEDYFSEGVHYSKLGEILKSILERIYNSKYVTPSNNQVIHVNYIEKVFTIVIRKSYLITFFPVSKERKLQELKRNFLPKKIDIELIVYVRK